MPKAPLHERLIDQFSYRGSRADVWRAFDRFLETGAYLNLGYSPRYLPHVVGSSQRRLAEVVGEGLATGLGETADRRLLDVGCGRGGPAVVFAEAYGFDVTGVDLVRYNVTAARRNAASAGLDADFVVGDAASLPVATDAVAVATALDALVYVPDVASVFAEVARTLRPGGVVAISDLLAVEPEADAAVRLDTFAEAWDMPALVRRDQYVDTLERSGLVVGTVRDLSPHSVGRFRRWTRLYLALADRAPGLVATGLRRWDLDADRITEQVRAAHGALPHLRHVLVYASAE